MFHFVAAVVMYFHCPAPDFKANLGFWQRALGLQDWRVSVQLVRIGLEHPDIRYEIVYGVSGNQRSWYDNSNAYRLGYRPQDDSEPQAAQVLAAEAGQPKSAVAERYQGGTFCADGYDAPTPRD